MDDLWELDDLNIFLLRSNLGPWRTGFLFVFWVGGSIGYWIREMDVPTVSLETQGAAYIAGMCSTFLSLIWSWEKINWLNIKLRSKEIDLNKNQGTKNIKIYNSKWQNNQQNFTRTKENCSFNIPHEHSYENLNETFHIKSII